VEVGDRTLKWIIILLLMFVFLFIPLVSGLNLDFSINNIKHYALTNYSSFPNDVHGLEWCWIEFDDGLTSVNTTHTALSGQNGYCENISRLLYPVNTNLTVRFWANDSQNPTSELFFNQTSFIVENQEESFDVRECPSETHQSILFMGLMIMVVFLLGISFMSGSGWLGMFTGLLVIVFSWYIVACIQAFALILFAIGIIIFITFAFGKKNI